MKSCRSDSFIYLFECCSQLFKQDVKFCNGMGWLVLMLWHSNALIASRSIGTKHQLLNLFEQNTISGTQLEWIPLLFQTYFFASYAPSWDRKITKSKQHKSQPKSWIGQTLIQSLREPSNFDPSLAHILRVIKTYLIDVIAPPHASDLTPAHVRNFEVGMQEEGERQRLHAGVVHGYVEVEFFLTQDQSIGQTESTSGDGETEHSLAHSAQKEVSAHWIHLTGTRLNENGGEGRGTNIKQLTGSSTSTGWSRCLRVER